MFLFQTLGQRGECSLNKRLSRSDKHKRNFQDFFAKTMSEMKFLNKN